MQSRNFIRNVSCDQRIDQSATSIQSLLNTNGAIFLMTSHVRLALWTLWKWGTHHSNVVTVLLSWQINCFMFFWSKVKIWILTHVLCLVLFEGSTWLVNWCVGCHLLVTILSVVHSPLSILHNFQNIIMILICFSYLFKLSDDYQKIQRFH